MRLSFDKGKYEVIFDEHTGTLEALRHGEPWRNLTGDNLILSMAQEVEALRAATSAKKPPYANLDEYLADLEAHASPAKEALDCVQLADSQDAILPAGAVVAITSTVTHDGVTRQGDIEAAKEATREGESRYARRDIEDLCEYYTRHLDAMTREDLHSKSDIAAELGWRDRLIEAAERRAADAEAGERTELSSVAKLLAFQPPYQARLAKRVEAIIAERDNLKERITAAESERDALKAEARLLKMILGELIRHIPPVSPLDLSASWMTVQLKVAELRRAQEALAPSSETTTSAES